MAIPIGFVKDDGGRAGAGYRGTTGDCGPSFDQGFELLDRGGEAQGIRCPFLERQILAPAVLVDLQDREPWLGYGFGIDHRSISRCKPQKKDRACGAARSWRT
jgi:hypothetical protein